MLLTGGWVHVSRPNYRSPRHHVSITCCSFSVRLVHVKGASREDNRDFFGSVFRGSAWCVNSEALVFEAGVVPVFTRPAAFESKHTWQVLLNFSILHCLVCLAHEPSSLGLLGLRLFLLELMRGTGCTCGCTCTAGGWHGAAIVACLAFLCICFRLCLCFSLRLALLFWLGSRGGCRLAGSLLRLLIRLLSFSARFLLYANNEHIN